jgi:dihydroorotate dehydrogenase (fumarate)
MEDAGSAALVLHSLFEEHISHESHQLHHHLTHGTDSFAESLSYFPEPNDLLIGPERYLNDALLHFTSMRYRSDSGD